MKVNRLIGLALAAGLLVPGLAFAESPRVGQLPEGISGTFETTVISSDGLVSGLSAGSIVYGFTTNATAATGDCGLYDADTVAEVADASSSVAQGLFIDEGSEATSGDSHQSLWPSPYKLTDGLFVIATDADCVIYHGVMN